MKALAIKQPWASLIIILGGKDIENRTWRTDFRGPVLIHASLKKDGREVLACRQLQQLRGITGPATGLTWDTVPLGGIIGVVDIVNCVTASVSPWFVGPFGFVLANPRPLPFRPLKGALGFFEAESAE